MKKTTCYVILVVVAVLSIIGFTAIWFVLNPISLVKIELEELPLGIEWGTEIEEVKEIMKDSYCVDETSSALIYEYYGYQGISGANARLIFFFNEGKLDSVDFKFAQNSEEATTSPEMQEKLWRALDEAYNKDSLAILLYTGENSDDCYYILDKTVVSIMKYDTYTSLHYFDRNSEDFREKTDAVIEEVKKTKNKTITISH